MTIFVFMNHLLLILVTSSLIWPLFLLRFSSNVLLQFLKILHLHYINKNVPTKREEMFIWEENVPPKRDPSFMKVGSLLDGTIYFDINRFWFFNKILLEGEISLNRGPHFAGMFFLYINISKRNNPYNLKTEPTENQYGFVTKLHSLTLLCHRATSTWETQLACFKWAISWLLQRKHIMV